jgi:hypothetical protein
VICAKFVIFTLGMPAKQVAAIEYTKRLAGRPKDKYPKS